MHVLELEYEMEQVMRDSVPRHHPLDWNENSITHHLVIQLRKIFRHTILQGVRFPVELMWEIYKFSGKPETDHGDIGLLFRYRLPTGNTIDGAGFLEAKIRGRGSNKFPHVGQNRSTVFLPAHPKRGCFSTITILFQFGAIQM
jgi:hypothetical protein